MKDGEIGIIRSPRRKTMALELRPDGTAVVRAPVRATDREIGDFIEKHRDWLEKNRRKMRDRLASAEKLPPLSFDELNALADKAMEYIPERCRYFAPLVGVTYGRITIRNQKTKWGSCSAKGNLNFNCLLMLAPPEIIDSVVVHELCHRKHMDHSEKFYAEVLRVMPDYHERNRWLKEHGAELMRRMTEGEKA